MTSRSSTFNSKFPLGFLIALAVIVAIESALSFFGEDLSLSPMPVMEKKKSRVIHREIESGSVYILGDSRYFSFSEKILSDFTGEDIVNLSWPSFGSDAYFYMLESFLYYDLQPKAVVVNFHPNFISVPPEKMLADGSEIVRTRSYYSIPSTPYLLSLLKENNAGAFWRILQYRLRPPSVAHRSEFIPKFKEFARTLEWPGYPENENRWLSEYSRGGGFVLNQYDLAAENTLTSVNENIFELKDYRSEEVVKAYRKFLDLTKEEEIPVIICNTPIPDFLYEYYEEKGILASWRSQLEMLIEDYPHVVLVGKDLEQWDRKFFSDLGHVNQEGNRKLHQTYPQYVREGLDLQGL